MSYAQLDSPLPGLTVSPTGERCCGMRGYQPGSHALFGMLGDDFSIDTGDPLAIDQPAPIDQVPPDIGVMNDLPLSPNILSPAPLDFPTTVGTEFTSNGDGTYTNIQTGQSVPYSIAQQITDATSGAGTANLSTVATGQDLNIVDPATGTHSSVNTNNLTAAAQALQAAGQLVDAAGKLTTQGAALLHSGNLYKAPQTTGFSAAGVGAGLSNAMSSLTSWMSNNPALAFGGALAILVALNFMVPMRKEKRRR